MATEHTLLILGWTLLTTGALYDEPGPNWYARRDPDCAKRHARHQHQLQALGFDVELPRATA